MAQQQDKGATLFVVATPLGNLQDVSPRARQVLQDVSYILAEDTRHTRILLGHLQIRKRLVSLHEHNEGHRLEQTLATLQAGESIALVSDAGTPAVSDPGATLVHAVHQAGLRICPIPGPSALSTAMSAAGFAAGNAGTLFLGFLQRKGKERSEQLQQIAAHPGIVVFFESPHRLAATMAQLAEQDATRPACLCRELTKLHEQIWQCDCSTLAAWAAKENVRGEVTVVLGAKAAVVRRDDAIDSAQMSLETAVQSLLDAGLNPRSTALAVSTLLGVPRRKAYQAALHAAPQAQETDAEP